MCARTRLDKGHCLSGDKMPAVGRFSLAKSLATLSIGVGAGDKRKAGGGAAPSRVGHYGLSNDSSVALAFVVLSRLVQSRDDAILQSAASTPVGASILAMLKAVTLRVATSVGGADAALNEVNMASLFNLSASAIATQRLYNGGLSLPSKLPWPRARALVNALLESVNAARTTDLGARVGVLLLRLPAAALDASAQADLTALVAAIEGGMRARVSGGGSGGGSSSGGSASGASGGTSNTSGASSSGGASSQSSPPPSEVLPLAVAVEMPSAVVTALSLRDNIRRLLEARLGRQLVTSEVQGLDDQLIEALTLLQTGDTTAQRQLLATDMASALLVAAGAQLWASAVETLEWSESSAAAYGARLTANASSVASALFASALGI